MDNRIAYLLGVASVFVPAVMVLIKQHEDFCKFDEKKTAFTEEVVRKLAPYAPSEVVEQLTADAKFLNIVLNEEFS